MMTRRTFLKSLFGATAALLVPTALISAFALKEPKFMVWSSGNLVYSGDNHAEFQRVMSDYTNRCFTDPVNVSSIRSQIRVDKHAGEVPRDFPRFGPRRVVNAWNPMSSMSQAT